MFFGRWKIVGGMMIAAGLAACSGTEGPQAPPMLADNACAQLRSDLNTMDKRGVPGLVDSRNNGKKLSPQQDAEASRYNQVLDQYLGGQCASEVRYKAKAGIPQAAPSERRASAQSAGMSTGSIPKSQIKRRKPADDDDTAAVTEKSEKVEKSVYTEEPAKSAKRKTSSTTSKAKTASTPAAASDTAAPAPTPVKAESGLPSAPAPTKSEDGEKKE